VLAVSAGEPEGPDPERMLRPRRPVASGYVSATAQLGFVIWRRAISPGDGARCPMHPTCSGYARQAFQREPMGGFLLTFDRLMRDGNPSAYEVAPDGLHALDPLADHPPAGLLLSGLYCARQRADGAEACL
jgi:putative component of membrane protein insertase Oxa1/YidC/SpoIIIJ protein YidD